MQSFKCLIINTERRFGNKLSSFQEMNSSFFIIIIIILIFTEGSPAQCRMKGSIDFRRKGTGEGKQRAVSLLIENYSE